MEYLVPARKKAKAKKKTNRAVAKRNPHSLPAEVAGEFEGHISRDRATVVAATGWPMIRTSASGFSLGGQKLPDLFPSIVLAGIRQNVLFEGTYNPQSTSLPTCAALDLEGDESLMAAPAKIAKAPLCVECEYNAWGSGAGRGKACKNQLKTAVLPYYPDLDYTKGGRGAVLNQPPTSLKLWADYATHVLEDLQRPLFSVITNFEIEVMQQGFRVVPTFGGPINDPKVLRALAVRAEEDAIKTLHLLPPISEEATPGGGKVTKGKDGVRRRKVVRR